MAIWSRIKFYWNEALSGLTATSTAIGYDVANLLDRLEGTKWKATSTADQYITHDAGHGKLTNGDFETGDTTGWTFSTGGSASATFTASSSSPYQGTYKGLITITNGGVDSTKIQLYQSNKSIVDGKRYKVIFVAKAAADRTGSIDLIKTLTPFTSYTDEGVQVINFTTSWQIFEFTFTSNVTADDARCQFRVGGDNNDIEIDVVGWYEEQTVTSDFLAISGHNFGSGGVAIISLEHSMDNFVADTQTGLAATDIVNDNSLVKEFTLFSARWTRLKITGMTAAPEMAICFWGLSTELDYATASFDPHSQNDKANVNVSHTGFMLGAHNKFIERSMKIRFNNAESTLYDKVKDWIDNNGLKNFFVAWEDANNADDVFLMRSTGKVNNPLVKGGLYRNISINLIGRRES